MNFVIELEFLGCQLERFELTDVKLDELNRNDLDRVRNALKTSFVPLSDSTELTNLWNTVMSKGPDSISGGDLPRKGATINTWLDAMIAAANKIREDLLLLLPYLGNTLREKWNFGPPVDARPSPFDAVGNSIPCTDDLTFFFFFFFFFHEQYGFNCALPFSIAVPCSISS
jgi:hypothetical protein